MTAIDDVTVVVKFLPAAARYVQESTWHQSQVLTRQRDGSLLARFRLSSTVEIKSWVLSFGANAVVLEPEALRAEIAAELEQLIKALRIASHNALAAKPPRKARPGPTRTDNGG